MNLITLHRYKKPTKEIFVNVELISTIEPYPETSNVSDVGAKIYFQQADVPVYINETCEEILHILECQGVLD